jgi:hypothetical protein
MKKLWLLPGICVVFMIFCVGSTWGVDFCVQPNGSGESDFQTALTTAQSNGEDDTIKVCQGTYTGNFYYQSGETDGLTLEGGYTTGCFIREVNPANTVLDGDNNGKVLQIISSGNSLGDIQVDGFTIKNGYATTSQGAGLHVSLSTSGETSGRAGSILITNNIITGNTSTATSTGAGVSANTYSYGTALAGTVSFINNIISGNTTALWGGGAYIRSLAENFAGETIMLLNNTISGNSATDGDNGRGGGIYIDMDENTINIFNNIIWGNTTALKMAFTMTTRKWFPKLVKPPGMSQLVTSMLIPV